MPKGFNTVILLAFISALGFSVTPMLMLVASLVGSQLSSKPELATLPIAIMVVGTALGVLPVSKIMQRFGRKLALLCFMSLLIIACLGAAVSLAASSFTGFCVSTFLVGVSNAATQQIRFAAMEQVAPNRAAHAASIVLLGGILAAFVGPELGVLGKNMTTVDFQGSFLLVIGLVVLSMLLLLLYKPLSNTANENHIAPTKGVGHLLAKPSFLLAVAASAVAYMVMTFVMTATPISMHHHFGHSIVDTKWVIQSHIMAMFLPSLLTPLWVRFIGLKGMIVAGLVCYTATIVLGYNDTSVQGFWLQLVVLGVGWNMLFVAGTALLPATYSDGEQYKAQSLNDSLVFSTQAAASLAAGWVVSHMSWQYTLLLCFVPMCLLLVAMVNVAFKPIKAA